MILGITGGIGTGKSTVLNILKNDFDFIIFEADKVAHELMSPGEPAYKRIVENFGPGILGENSEIDRKILGNIVLHNKEKLELLNSITHNEVINEIKRRISEKQLLGKNDFVIEAALLIESGCDRLCDVIWLIDAEEKVRMDRLKSGRKMTEEDIKKVMKNQMSSSEYITHCNAVINNNNSIEDTRAQIEKLLEF